jgi:hypothetical protein
VCLPENQRSVSQRLQNGTSVNNKLRSLALSADYSRLFLKKMRAIIHKKLKKNSSQAPVLIDFECHSTYCVVLNSHRFLEQCCRFRPVEAVHGHFSTG